LFDFGSANGASERERRLSSILGNRAILEAFVGLERSRVRK
jgi:hypothetical protein